MLKCDECSAHCGNTSFTFLSFKGILCISCNNTTAIIATIVIFKVFALHQWLMKERSHVTQTVTSCHCRPLTI